MCHYTMSVANLLLRSLFAAAIGVGQISLSVAMSMFVFSSAISNGTMYYKGLNSFVFLLSSQTPWLKKSHFTKHLEILQHGMFTFIHFNFE